MEDQPKDLAPSESASALDELFAALSAAQGEGMAALKDTIGQIGQQKTRYADLASCWEACRKPLAKYGLCVAQLTSANGTTVTVKTILGHKSGQSISASLTMTSASGTPQALGSTITYARRYALCSMVGIAPEDDDGSAGSARQAAYYEAPNAKEAENPSPITKRAIPTELAAIVEKLRKEPTKTNVNAALRLMEDRLCDKLGTVEGVLTYKRISEAFQAMTPDVKVADIVELLMDLFEASNGGAKTEQFKVGRKTKLGTVEGVAADSEEATAK